MPPAGRPPWSLADLLSRPRLAPYLTVTSGDPVGALELYNWNAQISSAFHESLHYVEIGLRNAMDRQLTVLVGCRGGMPWYLDPVVPLRTPARRKIEVARAHATRDGGPEIHGKVVAELMLGFWCSLLADEYNRRLWQPCLQYAFDGSVRRARLHAALDELRRLRNRIAHHEPIHNRRLHDDYHRALDTADRISPLLGARIRHTSRVPSVLADRPRAA